MKTTLKRMLALMIAMLLAFPTFALSEAAALTEDMVDVEVAVDPVDPVPGKSLEVSLDGLEAEEDAPPLSPDGFDGLPEDPGAEDAPDPDAIPHPEDAQDGPQDVPGADALDTDPQAPPTKPTGNRRRPTRWS